MQADQLLGCSNVLIAGAKYLINTGHTLRPVGHGSDSLYASGFEYPAYARHPGSKQHCRMHLAVASGGSTQHDFPAPGNACRHSQHQHRTEQWSRPSGNIQSYPLNRHRLLPASHPGLCLHPLPFKALGGMKSLNILLGQQNGCFQFFTDRLPGFLHFVFRHRQRSQGYFIELFFIFQHGPVAFAFHPAEDGANRVKQMFGVHHRTLHDVGP